MSRLAEAAQGLRRAHGATFMRFCAVGAVGFLVDAAVLEGAIHLIGFGPVAGRFVSFPVAVLATFELNRRWAFGDAGHRSYLHALATYVAVQALGLGCNLAVFSIAILALPAPLNTPLLCLALASGVALMVNYIGARLMVFRGPRA